jgi:hypothetical protein
MFKWLRWSLEEIESIAAHANRMVARSSERGEPPCDVDRLKSLSASSAKLMAIDAPAALLALPRIGARSQPLPSAGGGDKFGCAAPVKTCRCFPCASQSSFWEA